jgi:hypothetical protein
MTENEQTALYGAQIRMQVALSALQTLVYRTREITAGDCVIHPDLEPGLHDAIRDGATAIQILLGGEHEVPESLTRNWRDRQMVRDARRVLAESAA